MTRSILIVGGGTAGWLTAAYLARRLGDEVRITLLESPEIGIIGVGEGAFPTIRSTLRALGIDESQFIREASATFKQGIRFVDWAATPTDGGHSHYFHPFEAPFFAEDVNLVDHWLRQDPATRPPFAEAVTIQNRVAEAGRAPKRPHEADFTGPLNYAYHFDAHRLARVLGDCARQAGVTHLEGRLLETQLGPDGAIQAVLTDRHGALTADLYVDCTGFRAELIGQALGSPFRSASAHLFTDRAVTARAVYDRPDAPIESVTIATAHEAGWTWDIGLSGSRGLGCVYSSRHMDDDRAEAILRAHLGDAGADIETRRIPFEAGYRERPWIRNCVAVGLAGGFLEPLESTGLVLIEAAAAMIADLFPRNGPVEAPARRFNALMTARYDTIITFLKLHYCLSRRTEPFWRDNADPASIPEPLRELLDQWRYRAPNRLDFTLDVESFAFYNYQYILYGMGFQTDLTPGAVDAAGTQAADRVFARIRKFGDRATQDLPEHRALITSINAG